MRLFLWKQQFSPQTRDCDICRFPFSVCVWGFFCQLHQEHLHLWRREKQYYCNNSMTTWILHGITLWTCMSDQKWSLNPNVLPEVVASDVFLSTDMAEYLQKQIIDCEGTAENPWTSVNSNSPGLSRVVRFPNIFQWDGYKVKLFETRDLIMACLESHVKWVLPLK